MMAAQSISKVTDDTRLGIALGFFLFFFFLFFHFLTLSPFSRSFLFLGLFCFFLLQRPFLIAQSALPR